MEYPAQGQEGSEHHLCLLDGSVPNDSVPHMVGGGSRLYSLLWPKYIAIFYLTDEVGGPAAQETSLFDFKTSNVPRTLTCPHPGQTFPARAEVQ